MLPTTAMFDDLWDDSHRTFRDMVRRFALEEIAPNSWEWEEAESFPVELYATAADAGILAPSYPEQYGGGGGDLLHSVVLLEELQRGGSTGVVMGLGSLGIALPPILNLGNDEQKARIVPDVLAGRKIAALAITEPGTGSDVAGVRTRAVRDGDDYIVSGSKTFITSGVRADYVTTLCRTGDDPHQGLTFLVIEKGMPGFTVSKSLKKTGWRASDTAELSFDEVRVPAANRIGPEGSGFIALMQNFEAERLMLAVNGCALAELALSDAYDYAGQRQAFGRPINRFQVTKHKLARMTTAVLAAKSLTYNAARQMMTGKPSMVEVACAKNFAADVAREVCWEAVQIFGGMGYMRETRVERFFRDARLIPIGGGTNEVMNEIIAKGMGL